LGDQARQYEAFDAVVSFWRALKVPGERTKAMALILIWPSLGASLGVGGAILYIIGQWIAIGFWPAFELYWQWWALAPVIGALIVSGMAAVGGLFSLLGDTVSFVLQRFLNQKQIDKVFGWVVGLMMLGFLCFLFIGQGYTSAKKANNILTSKEAGNLDKLVQTTAENLTAVSELSRNAQGVLTEIDKFQQEFSETKQRLTATLTALQTQKKKNRAIALDEQLKQLQSQGVQVELKRQELLRVLEGQEPISREDLDNASTSGMVYGIIWGFLSSLAASAAYSKMQSWRRQQHAAKDFER